MRLTADLIQNSLSYINPLKERELDLRGATAGHKIPAIENLGVARDQDCIDLTDNDLTLLANFPLNPRLQTLLLARNRIAALQPTLHKSIPRLTTLVLTHNRLAELADLDPLSHFSHLTYLSLIENPVALKENYRYWVIWCIPSVRFLDFVKVRDAERTKAKTLFGTAEEPTPLATKIMGIKSKGFDMSANGTTRGAAGAAGEYRVQLTDKERARIRTMITNAKSLQEIARLEKELNEGRVPGGVLDDDAMEE
ncbi:L domain-like protein [Trichodelitschia bisporula]|uniref:U2 small nuclear ribonucleoprotein A' n=1 Tax=Trichodelitschia bisporula TaxID=703511 RepID=A0A6G1HL31_9PEZI|nr:L domain-like protein [Trichodelitschia bisporula]